MNDSNEDKKDAFYSEELSRAAVQRLFDDDDDDTDKKGKGNADAPQPVKSAFVSGFDRSPTKNREKFKPGASAPPVEEPLQAQPPPQPDPEEPERPRRRESATNRILHGDAPEAPPEVTRPGRERQRRRNPAPSPAVRVNVEHPVRPSGPPQSAPQPQPAPAQGDEPQSEEDMESFRKRYNAGELFSPPRNTNRPVRPGRTDVRTNRMRSDPNSAEPISPLRIIMAVALIFMFAIVAFLTWQLISARRSLRESAYYLDQAQGEVSALQGEMDVRMHRYSEDLAQALEANRGYREILSYHELGPFAPPPPGDGITDAGDIDPTTTPTTPAASGLPTQHTVQPGESMWRIARRYFPGVDETQAIAHIAAVNNITNVDNVPAGRTLEITPMP